MKASPACLITILCAILMAGFVRAQHSDKDFRLYSIRDGLGDNLVTSLQQDNDGYLWIGTMAGLNRFDGVSFTKYNQGIGPIYLPSDFITQLKKFGPNRLGIFSRAGFQILRTDTYKVTNYLIEDSTSFVRALNASRDAIELPDGSFAMTSAAGFYVLNEKKLLYRYDAFNIKDIGRKQILYGREIFPAGDDNYIVYTNEDGQALFNSRRKSLTPIEKEDARWLPYMHPHQYPGDRWLIKRQLNDDEFLFIPLKGDSIVYYNRIRNKRLASPLPASYGKQLNWASQLELMGDTAILLSCGNTGFFQLRFDHRSGRIEGIDKKFLAEYEVTSFLLDKVGGLWVGTTRGLLKEERKKPLFGAFEYPLLISPSNHDVFTCTYRYKEMLYAGQYSRHHGLTIIDAATMKVIREVQFYGNDSQWNEVITMQMYHPDTLWIGTFAGVLWFDTKSGRFGKVFDEKKYPWAAQFPAVLGTAGSDGYAWFCARLGARVVRYHIPSHTFTLFSPQTSPALPFEKVKNITYDSYGDVWIGGHSLTRWNNRLQTFDTLINVYGGPNKFNDDIVMMTADQNGSLWLHNADNTLLEYRIKERRFVSYGLKEGLPSTAIGTLSDVIGYKMWIASTNSLYLMDTRTKQFTVYDYHDGLPDRRPSCRKIYLDPIDSLLYLCSENYIVRFPIEPKRGNDESGDLLLEGVTINNDSTIFRPIESIELSHAQNNVTLHFTVVDYERNNYQFAYRLNGAEAWTAIGDQRSLSFNNLSPGKYFVELSASGQPGSQKTRSLLIVIDPPFWARAWFIILAVLCIASLIFWFVRMRVNRLKQRANIDRLLSQSEMKALQAQMNPHFVFNSLNSIREMILNQENKEASHYLSKFAQLIRITLDQSTQEVISLRATIDYLQRYIEMETIRNGFLKYEFNVDKTIDQDETLVSPMMIQPFVENAIWHGVSASRKDVTVKIGFRRKGDSLACTVDDDGIGIAYAKSLKKINGRQRRSHGIANVENRIALLNEKYNLHCQVTIVDKQETLSQSGSGTLVTIELPYQTTDL